MLKYIKTKLLSQNLILIVDNYSSKTTHTIKLPFSTFFTNIIDFKLKCIILYYDNRNSFNKKRVAV